MKMFSFALAALAGAGACAMAFAASAQPAPPPPDTVDWNGPYVGVNAGWEGAASQAGPGVATTQQLTGVSAGAGAVSVPPATFPTRRMDYSSSSFAGGGQVGYNHQIGHVVLGLEGDMDGTN